MHALISLDGKGYALIEHMHLLTWVYTTIVIKYQGI